MIIAVIIYYHIQLLRFQSKLLWYAKDYLSLNQTLLPW